MRPLWRTVGLTAALYITMLPTSSCQSETSSEPPWITYACYPNTPFEKFNLQNVRLVTSVAKITSSQLKSQDGPKRNCMMTWVWSLVIGTVFVCVSTQDDMNFCPDMRPPRNFDLNQIMGLFFAVEIVQHRDEPRHRGVRIVDSCPLVKIDRVNGAYSMVKLLWHEQAGHVEYHFSIPNMDNPGYWMSSGPQNGSMLQRPYRQFAGTVQVMKVANNYVVLTFCSPNSEHYSVLLSRDKKMRKAEIMAVNDMLISKNLQQVGVKEACKDSATAISSSIVLTLTAITAFCMAS